ncbi:tripartite tricarboxylate transporter substrate-binding protein [Piscinibacter sakaiensis]|uniref:Putative exported protein n=1 Tax=Piscinibacter sakaiensis TaxID=1547922 RepID=A0A0K8P697_PISS1|nr:tripartite tricarboxylate transporter substrate-binding protein [Piscinibacter sakaiensis]GAP38121.1 putative exported protein [Piscinibacter sakaiensis]
MFQTTRQRIGRMGRAVLLATALGGLAAAPAGAQDAFPSRPVKILIPTAPGGNMDTLARIVAEKMTASWGQQVIVESRAGANTVLATTAVAKSPPDGYTALFTLSGFVQNLVLMPSPPYKVADFAPVSMVAVFPIALAANANLPANTLQEVVKLAHEKPDTISFGSYGVGSGGHIIGEGLNKAAGIRLNHVPYKGEAAAFPDLVSGQIGLAYGSTGFYSSQVGTGKVKLIAVASPKRLKAFPNVPTFAEGGYPDVNLAGWGGMLLPAATPPAIVDKYTAELRRIVALPEVQARILQLGFEPAGTTREEFAQAIAGDIQRWGAIVRANNIKLE